MNRDDIIQILEETKNKLARPERTRSSPTVQMYLGSSFCEAKILTRNRDQYQPTISFQPEGDSGDISEPSVCNSSDDDDDGDDDTPKEENSNELFHIFQNIPGINGMLLLPLLDVSNVIRLLLRSKRMVTCSKCTSKPTFTEMMFGRASAPLPDKTVSFCVPEKRVMNLFKPVTTISAQGNCHIKMEDYKKNYIFHALNMNEIYMQYVSCFQDNSITKNSKIYARQLQTLLVQSSNFMKDYVTYFGKFGLNSIIR